MARIRIARDQKTELDKHWLEWHRSLGRLQITAVMEAGRDDADGTTSYDIDDRFRKYLKDRKFRFE